MDDKSSFLADIATSSPKSQRRKSLFVERTIPHAGRDARRDSLPVPMRNTTAPGIPSKVENSMSNVRYAQSPPIPNRTAGRLRSVVPKHGMEPVMEDSVDRHSGSGALIQLPSPPASPDEHINDWRFDTSRVRPSLTSAHTTPLPFRPRSATVASPPPSISSALQADLSRPQSSSIMQRYSSGTFSSPQSASRSRASTISNEAHPRGPRPLPVPGDASARPVSGARRSSLAIAEASTTQHAQSPYLRHASLQPHTQQMHEVAGAPPPLSGGAAHASSSTMTEPARAGSDRNFSSRPHNYARSLTESNLHTPGTHAVAVSKSHQQPALVRRKDSTALRPLPVSHFLQSPPHSPPFRGTVSSRSRSGSVATIQAQSLSTQLPPLEPLSPLEFETLLPEDKEKREKKGRWDTQAV